LAMFKWPNTTSTDTMPVLIWVKSGPLEKIISNKRKKLLT